MSRYGRDGWPAYVSVGERKKKAAKHVQALQKKGKTCHPVIVEGRKIAKTFWGEAWCKNLETYSDYENRLPRGRTYVRNGSVIDLEVTQGLVKAQVMGSFLYHVTIQIEAISKKQWEGLIAACAGKIDSLIELLQGKFSKAVMEIITQKESGLFPQPREIDMHCSCPDSAGMCKHVAAVLYGVGAILDTKPEWLFLLRHVSHLDLMTSAHSARALTEHKANENELKEDELSTLFGIEINTKPSGEAKQKAKRGKQDRPTHQRDRAQVFMGKQKSKAVAKDPLKPQLRQLKRITQRNTSNHSE